MYIVKNALLSIIRNKTRNILISIIIFVIACITTITLATSNAASNLTASYQNQYEVIGSLSMNRKNLMQDFNPQEKNVEDIEKKFTSIEPLTVEEIEKYADSAYLKSSYYTETIGMNANLTKAETTQNFKEKKGSSGDFTVKGYSSLASMSEFIEGTYSITQGEINSDLESNSCIINQELATINNLSVGDIITLTSPNDENITFELTITGIFEEKEEIATTLFSTSANTIITSTNMTAKLKEQDETLTSQITPTFVLTDKNVIEAFQNELTEKGLSESYTFTTNLDQIESATESIQNVKNFSLTFLIMTLCIGGIVLFVINMLNVRERKYEIGVLRTIGMKKSLVCLEFLSELLIVAIISITLGLCVGTLTSVPIANHLLANEIENSQKKVEQVNNNFGRPSNMGEENKNIAKEPYMGSIVQIEKIDNINAIVDGKVAIELFLVGILLVIISSLSALLTIQRFSPLTILKERS